MGTRSQVHAIELREIILPEFSRTRRISTLIMADVFDAPQCRYDVIVGRDILTTIGIDLDFKTRTIRWDDLQLAMRHRDFFAQSDAPQLLLHDICADDPTIGDNHLLDAGYARADLHDLMEQQQHLTSSQRQDLFDLWSQCDDLFSGKLGTYPDRVLHLHLKPGATPVHHRSYQVPRNIQENFQKELARFVDIGILEKVGATEWAAPHFAIPKKDGRIRFVSDFRSLNAQLERRVYPLPRIEDILHRHSGYKYFTKLDITMCFHTFLLDEESSNLCVVNTPFGKYRYKRLPMGIKQSPDYCQEIMEDVLRDFRDFLDVYMDDIGVFSNSWTEHIEHLRVVLHRLQEKGFAITPHKCEWAVQETDFLGYWLTPTGIKPWKKKVDAIIALAPPSTMKALRAFVGMINFYRTMYPKRAHTLAPLTSQTGRNTLTWTPECQKAFEAAKALLVHDAFIRYPDHNKPFHVYTDASDYQLGAVIKQDNAPVAYFSRKLNAAQRNYTTIEKELLSIVETLKEFRTMLLGCNALHVYTDHRNLTYTTLNSQRVLRWRLFLEEYNPIFHYIPGQENEIADALSRLPLTEEEKGHAALSVDASQHSDLSDKSGKHSVFRLPSARSQDDPRLHTTRDTEALESPIFMDEELIDVYLNHPEINVDHPLPIDYATIQQHQQATPDLLALVESHPQQYHMQHFPTENPTYELLCYRKNENAPWRIRVPDTLLQRTVEWYHLVMGHLGANRLRDTINTFMAHPQLSQACAQLTRDCDICQRAKIAHRNYGHLSPREVRGNRWADIAVDLIGPWAVSVLGTELRFRALTIIDQVTNYCEIIRIHNKTAHHVGTQLENAWLSRYPRPVRCHFDQGKEFTGQGFLRILQNHGIKPVVLTVKNPQSNAICERLHMTIGNVLRTILRYNVPENVDNAIHAVDTALQTAAYAVRAANHGTLRCSPGSLAFNRDMIFDIPLMADLEVLRQNRQLLVDERARRANRSRVFHDYAVGEQVYIRNPDPAKLDLRTSEHPFTITQVHTNGTVTIQRSPHVTERINIRRLLPFRG